MDEQVFKLVGFDGSGARRVWAADYNKDVAETRCRDEALAYLRGRPETGPLSKWKFEWK